MPKEYKFDEYAHFGKKMEYNPCSVGNNVLHPTGLPPVMLAGWLTWLVDDRRYRCHKITGSDFDMPVKTDSLRRTACSGIGKSDWTRIPT